MRRRDGAARGATRDRIGDFAGGEPGPIPGRGTAEHPRRSVNARLGAPSHPNGAALDELCQGGQEARQWSRSYLTPSPDASQRRVVDQTSVLANRKLHQGVVLLTCRECCRYRAVHGEAEFDELEVVFALQLGCVRVHEFPEAEQVRLRSVIGEI